MRQKYFISREDGKNELHIKEYAILHKTLKKLSFSMMDTETFSFLGEQSYDGVIISDSICKGLDTLVETLRTRNMYPIRTHAVKIAESVMGMYESGEDRSVELFFDDIDSFEKPLETAA